MMAAKEITPVGDPGYRVFTRNHHMGRERGHVILLGAYRKSDNDGRNGAALTRDDALAVVKMLLDGIHALGEG